MIKHSSVLALLLTCFVVSCEDDYPYYSTCHCRDNGIGGWDNPKDTTSVGRQDTVGGFEISVEKWKDSEIHDIKL